MATFTENDLKELKDFIVGQFKEVNDKIDKSSEQLNGKIDGSSLLGMVRSGGRNRLNPYLARDLID
ncbi:hypothetical protein myaer102_33500 [Microcystis viridis NIES-102]|uniref:Uncharacterized protein n=1 Tax=Microcystis viridis NIES-102 TaxID=213615 RepID=A0A3G9JJT1_MICVR|nr:hypothetical protein myaer102_33500 [Microcystis viridis NIES-102]